MDTTPKPHLRYIFRRDLINNLMEKSEEKKRKLTRSDYFTECIMYSCEMCLDFRSKTGLIISDWNEHITREVGEALKYHFPDFFSDSDIVEAIDEVKKLLDMPGKFLKGQLD